MSEYPKAITLHGRTSLLGPMGITIYRCDSPDDEQRIREYHAKCVENTRIEIEELFSHEKD